MSKFDPTEVFEVYAEEISPRPRLKQAVRFGDKMATLAMKRFSQLQANRKRKRDEDIVLYAARDARPLLPYEEAPKLRRRKTR